MTGIKKPDDLVIRFSNYSQKAINAHQIQSHDGKFRPDELSEKGQLFVLAGGVDGYQADPQAKEIALRVIHESYYSDSSRDIVTSLQNAFKDANTLVNEIFNENANRAHLGIACTGLVLTNDRVYVARIGDSSTYRITRQKLQDVSALTTGTQPSLLRARASPDRAEARLALGVEPEIELEVNEVPLKSGDCFLLCSDRLIDVGVEEIRRIVRSNPPGEACRKLIDCARQMGVGEQTDVQVIWVSAIQPTPDSTAGNITELPFFTKVKLMAAAAVLLLLTAAFLQTVDLENIFPSNSGTKGLDDPQQAYDDEARLLLAEANAFFDAGELDVALSRYRAVRDLGVADSLTSARIGEIFEIYKDKANLYYQKGHYSRALNFYEKALALAPESTHLASLIAACKKKLGSAPDARPATAAPEASPNSGDDVRVGRPPSATGTGPGRDRQTQIWDWSSVPEGEIIPNKDSIRFLNSVGRSRVLSRKALNQFELRLTTTVEHESGGRYGVIVGYQTMSESPYETFYLMSLSPEHEFLLHRYANFKKEILASVSADSMAATADLSFVVRCSDAGLRLYCGERLIFDWTASEAITGRIGLYAGPDTDVTFSNLELTEKK